MRLRHRVLRTVGFNLGLFLVPWLVYQTTRAVMLYGSYQGWWALRFVS